MLARIALAGVNVHLAGRHVLHDVAWSLEAGQHWAIVGANGSGKSTLLRVIAGQQWVDAGGVRRYSPDGSRSDVVARAATWIRQVTAEQHEHYARLDLGLDGRAVIASGFDDSLYLQRDPTPAESQRVDELIAEFGLGAIAARAIRHLSTGQLRRLLIARAFVAEPRVIVLDEFMNGLDRGARADVLTFLDRLAARASLVIASHRNADFPAAVTHTAQIAAGRIVATSAGRPEHRPPRAAPPAVARREPAAARPVLVRIRNADVYRGRTRVLENVNWDLRRGEHTAIRGANGAGKTTFAGLIAGTISAATGATIVRFGETGPFDVWKLKERIAHISDDLQIAYDRGETVEAVVTSGFPASIGLFIEPTPDQRAAVAAILQRVGLEALAPRTFTRLSFGERRKILIARSLVRRPTIFILDEVWNGLDREFRSALRSLLADMAQTGTTIVAIAHDEDDDVISLASRICTIEHGKILEQTSSGRAASAPSSES